MSDFRIGYGYDVHRLTTHGTLVLGGVSVSDAVGVVAHSDGDVLLHAICDAMLGAAALGDIGKHFPDTDERYRGISSLILLHECAELIRQRGYRVGNIDTTVVLESPKIMRFIDAMRAKIAEHASIEIDCVSIKATTSEAMGFVGRSEGIVAHAVVLLTKS